MAEITLDSLPTDKRIFLQGITGSGKTTLATQWLLRLLQDGVPPDRILITVPQVTLGRPYQLALHEIGYAGGGVPILTVSGLARTAVGVFWPLVGGPLGFAAPDKEPIFLNIETAQYYMARIADPAVQEKRFGAVQVSPQRVVSQTIDNLNRAALIRFPVDEIAERLGSAWDMENDPTRQKVYDAAVDLAREFRDMCLANNLLDFSLLIEAFTNVLMLNDEFTDYLGGQFDYLIAENVEEDNPVAHDLLTWFLPRLKGGLIIYDTDGGHRTFLGSDPDHASNLQDECDLTLTLSESRVMSPELRAFTRAVNQRIDVVPYEPPPAGETPESQPDPRAAFTLKVQRFYPQMIDWAAAHVVELVKSGVPPREIVILAPFISDALRFALTYQIETLASQQGLVIPTLSHRPSRALRDEPATRAMLTLTALAHPHWGRRPPVDDVADALSQVLADTDPIRARLLTDIVYRKRDDDITLSAFTQIKPDMQKRISFTTGERYDVLRGWLEGYHAQIEHEGVMPLDHFLSRLFGEVLSQPGFGFHANLETGRVVAQLIASAGQFRRALYPGDEQDWNEAGLEYIDLINRRLLPALFAQSWQDEVADAVFIAPASTFLLRNRFVDHQIWLDIGSESWAKRLDQPLTHPFVLRRDYPAGQLWSDDDERAEEDRMLYRIVVGLVRRCRKQISMGLADLTESGFEQRGRLLRLLQQIMSAGQVAALPPEMAEFANLPDDGDDETDESITEIDETEIDESDIG